METLPVEIIELIFNYCETKTLAVSIPRVSKLFKKYSEDDSNIWKAKCEQKYLNLISKPPDQSWKRYYFPEVLKLFPFHGFIIFKTTHEEMMAQPNAIEKKQEGATDHVVYNTHQFWERNGVFDFLYLTYGDELPNNWTRQGLSWDISFDKLKELLKKKVGNYHVTDGPYQEHNSEEYCFFASITSAVKEIHGEDAIHYDLTFGFNHTPGTETTPGTLNKICIGESDINELKRAYEERTCID